MGTAKARFQDNAGMTVVEVIIALGVITVGLVALIAAMPLSTSLIGQSNLKTTAAFLAQQRMEQIKNAQWITGTDTLGGSGSAGTGLITEWPDEAYNTITIPMGANSASYPRFRREVRIKDCSQVTCSSMSPTDLPTTTVGINTLREVTVTVFFFPLTGLGTRLATEDAGSHVCGDQPRQPNEDCVQVVTLIAFRP